MAISPAPRELFYKYATASTAKTVLTTRRLRWSSPLLFNDPFDVTQTLRLDIDPAALSKLLVEETARVLAMREPPPVTSAPLLRELHRMLGRAGESVRREDILAEFRLQEYPPTRNALQAFDDLKAAWAELVPRFRILCLSESPDVTPMWQHYADAYQGVVLELRSAVEVDSALALARPVIYQDEPPRIASPQAWAEAIVRTNGAELHVLLTESEYVKTRSWAYEREWRVISMARSSHEGLFTDFGFHSLELHGVYLGARCSATDREAITSYLSDDLAHVSLFQARITGQGTSFMFEQLR